MGFNIYEDTLEIPMVREPSQRGSENQMAEQIFLQHAKNNDLLFQGAPFDNLCASLADAFPSKLAGLRVPQMGGRAWEFFDENHDGVLTLAEFMNGFGQLLNPTTEQARSLRVRLECGLSRQEAQAAGGYAHVQRVAVIGAGVAGLQVANLLRPLGKEVVIFEKSAKVGGVWRQNYADFGLQVPKELFEFPGFPWPSDKKSELFPPGPEVQEYIERYAKEFSIEECIKFETAVLEAAPQKGDRRGWAVTYQSKGARQVTEDFDFLVVATGMYSWPPHVPLARDFEKFKGEILHSCTFTDRKAAAGKKVVVIGGGKSAIDNAVAAAKEGVSTTLVCRHPHWPVPRYLANLVPFKWGTYSRFGHSTLPAHHEVPSCAWWTHSVCTPLKWVWWRVVETMFKAQFRIPADRMPQDPIEIDLFTGGQILNYNFREMCKKGTIKNMNGAISRFTESGVVLMDGTELEADLVIYGTGFTKNYDLFDSSFVQPLLGLEKDGLWLYRNMIPPRLRDLAFIGCEIATFNNILTHGLQALWLQRLLAGSLDLPSPGFMEKQIEKERAWKRSWMPPCSARASLWQLHMMVYHDSLVRDMGENPKRKAWNKLGEIFAPYTARDYAGLFRLSSSSSK